MAAVMRCAIRAIAAAQPTRLRGRASPHASLWRRRRHVRCSPSHSRIASPRSTLSHLSHARRMAARRRTEGRDGTASVQKRRGAAVCAGTAPIELLLPWLAAQEQPAPAPRGRAHADMVGKARSVPCRASAWLGSKARRWPMESPVGQPRRMGRWSSRACTASASARVWSAADPPPCHIGTGTGLTPWHICTGVGLAPATSAPGPGSPARHATQR
jgi:hypothetical protein